MSEQQAKQGFNHNLFAALVGLLVALYLWWCVSRPGGEGIPLAELVGMRLLPLGLLLTVGYARQRVSGGTHLRVTTWLRERGLDALPVALYESAWLIAIALVLALAH